MGVKDLWQILAPTCERKSLWELQDKTLAVDLSGWVCDSQTVAEYSSQPKMYLRNLFFRTSCLLLLGACPIFVLEGTAPDMKLKVMAQRNALRGLSQPTQATKHKSGSGTRRRYNSIQKQCQEMLESMGVQCVQSVGEAEAFCAFLNAKEMVDGCITQDSDCFLYGGRVVYRNFTISASSGGGGGPGFSVDVYNMDQVEKSLGLSRNKLVGLSLLCGCDYNQTGVAGVGKETALKFILTLDDSDIFSRFQRWKDDPYYEHLEKERTLGTCDFCGHFGKHKQHEKEGCNQCGTVRGCTHITYPDGLGQKNLEERKLIVNELNIRKKALQDPTFPSQEMIQEFLYAKEKIPDKLQCQWKQPNLIKFIKLAEKQLCWEESYSLEKFLPLLTRWLLLNHNQKNTKCPVFPEKICKSRVLKGVASYEIRWDDSAGLFETLLTSANDANDEANTDNLRITIEPKVLVEKAFPDLVRAYNEELNAIKLAKKKAGKGKSTRKGKAAASSEKCSSCGKVKQDKKQKCMCEFIGVEPDHEEVKRPRTLEEYLDGLALENHTAEESGTIESKQLRQRKGTEKTESDSPFKHASAPKILKRNRGRENTNTVAVQSPDELERCVVSKFPTTNQNSGLKDGKMSFESLLNGEDWSMTDFGSDVEMDLSDVVQSIINRPTKTPTISTPLSTKNLTGVFNNTPHTSTRFKCDSTENKWKTPELLKMLKKFEEPSDELKVESLFSNMCGERGTPVEQEFCSDKHNSSGSLYEVPESPQSTGVECVKQSNEKLVRDRKTSPQLFEYSSDEDAPYTPLVDRVKLLRQEEARYIRRPSVLSSPQARRFSESFEAFIAESIPVSSPQVQSNQDSYCSPDLPPQYFENGRGTFSLGISDVLEGSN